MIFNIRLFILLVLSLLVTFIMVKPAVSAVQEIVAVVNEDAISVNDLNKRMKLVMASSGLSNSKELRAKLTPQILDGLIDERLMLQEAHKIGIEVVKPEIDEGFARVAGQNNTSSDQFKSMLQRSGIDISTMSSQIEAQVAWSKFVQARLRSKVIVSDRDVDDVLERMSAKIGTKEYLVAEIFLPAGNPKKEVQAAQLANRLVGQIKSGKASFFKLAQQFSKSAGSSTGGNIGWVDETQISEEIIGGLKNIKKNQVTNPIKERDGYHILFLRDVRILSADTIPSREQVFYTLGNERLEKMQRRHLMDLKASSFIDIRI